jgi:hypothetical protein
MKEYRFLYYDPMTQNLESFDAYFSDVNVYADNLEKNGIHGILALKSNKQAMQLIENTKRSFKEKMKELAASTK